MAKIGCERVCWDGVRATGKLREMEARVFFRPSNRLIPYGLAETPGMPPLILHSALGRRIIWKKYMRLMAREIHLYV